MRWPDEPGRHPQTITYRSPDVVVNAARAAVDKAKASRSFPTCWTTKGGVAGGKVWQKLGALMVHYSRTMCSTAPAAYYRQEDEATGPLNVYGENQACQWTGAGAGQPRHLIFRTSWVYATQQRQLCQNHAPRGGWKGTLSIVTTNAGAPPALSCWRNWRRQRQSVKRYVIRRWPAPIIWWPAAKDQLVRLRPYVFEVAKGARCKTGSSGSEGHSDDGLSDASETSRSTLACRMKNSSRHLGWLSRTGVRIVARVWRSHRQING